MTPSEELASAAVVLGFGLVFFLVGIAWQFWEHGSLDGSNLSAWWIFGVLVPGSFVAVWGVMFAFGASPSAAMIPAVCVSFGVMMAVFDK